jgi:hypothetical protein
MKLENYLSEGVRAVPRLFPVNEVIENAYALHRPIANYNRRAILNELVIVLLPFSPVRQIDILWSHQNTSEISATLDMHLLTV